MPDALVDFERGSCTKYCPPEKSQDGGQGIKKANFFYGCGKAALCKKLFLRK